MSPGDFQSALLDDQMVQMCRGQVITQINFKKVNIFIISFP